jgi:hypothetical protein
MTNIVGGQDATEVEARALAVSFVTIDEARPPANIQDIDVQDADLTLVEESSISASRPSTDPGPSLESPATKKSFLPVLSKLPRRVPSPSPPETPHTPRLTRRASRPTISSSLKQQQNASPAKTYVAPLLKPVAPLRIQKKMKAEGATSPEKETPGKRVLKSWAKVGRLSPTD